MPPLDGVCLRRRGPCVAADHPHRESGRRRRYDGRSAGSAHPACGCRHFNGDGAEIERFTYADGPRGPRLASLRHEAFGYSIAFRYLEDPAVPDSTADKPGPDEEKAQ